MFKKFCLLMVCCFSMVIGLLLSACSSNISLTILFDSDGGSLRAPIVYCVGKNFDMPEDPIKTNCYFDGWFTDKDRWESPFTVDTILNYPLTQNTTIFVYAKWVENVKLIFDSNGGSVCGEVFLDNKNINLPTPSLNGYTFGGWFLDDVTFAKEYHIGDKVETNDGNILLYAKWIKGQKKTIYYTTNISNITLKKDYDVLDIDESVMLFQPKHAGFVFEGWFYDDNFLSPAPDKISNLDINTYNNTITLYAKFTQLEIRNLTILGELQTEYNYGENFNANGAKLKIEYVDKNYDDEIVNITEDIISGFYTTDDIGNNFVCLDDGVEGIATIRIGDTNTYSTSNNNSISFNYIVKSDIKEFNVKSGEFKFIHGGDNSLRNKNIIISWTDLSNNHGETKLEEFSNYTMNYDIRKKTSENYSKIYFIDWSMIEMGYRNNGLDLSECGDFTARLRFHFKTIEVTCSVLANENVTKGYIDKNIYLNTNSSILDYQDVGCVKLYDSVRKVYINWRAFAGNAILQDIATDVAGEKTAKMLYNDKEIEIEYYVIDCDQIKTASINDVELNDARSGLNVKFVLNDNHVFYEFISEDGIIDFDTSTIGKHTCKIILQGKEFDLNYVVK